MKKLTPKQKAFCLYYIENMGNAAQAAIKAGYSEKTARSIGHELLTKPDIKRYINEIMENKHNERFMSAEEVIERLADRARLSERDGDKIKALELLGKYHRVFSERIELDVNKTTEYVAEWGKDDN